MPLFQETHEAAVAVGAARALSKASGTAAPDDLVPTDALAARFSDGAGRPSLSPGGGRRANFPGTAGSRTAASYVLPERRSSAGASGWTASGGPLVWQSC